MNIPSDEESPFQKGPIKVMLLSVNWHREGDPRTPLGIAYIYSWLRTYWKGRRSLALSLVDCDVRDNLSNVIHKIYLESPDILGFGVYVWNADAVSKIITSLRLVGYNGAIILGGPEITYGDENLPEEFPDADYFIKGEGEQAFQTAVDSISSGLPPSGDGIFSRTSKHFNHFAQIGESERIIQPHTIKELLPRIIGNGFTRMQWQRGCLFGCSFCAFKFPNRLFRDIGIQKVKEELKRIKAHKVKRVAILDPIFFMNKEKGIEILRLMKEVTPEIEFEIQTRIEHLDPQLISLLSDMKVRLECGVQTLDPMVQRKIKRVNNFNKIEEYLGLLHRKNVTFETHLIYGLPFQTLDSFLKDLDTLISYKPSKIRVFPLSLLKGTDLAFSMNTEYLSRLEFSPIFPKEVLKTDWMSSEEIMTLKNLQYTLDKNMNNEADMLSSEKLYNNASLTLRQDELSKVL